MPRWAEAADVHKRFHGGILTSEGLVDATDIDPRIEEAERYIEARLPFPKADMDLWTTILLVPRIIRDLVATLAAAYVIRDTQAAGDETKIGWLKTFERQVERALDDIRSGNLKVYTPASADITPTATVDATYDADDREFTRENMKDL